MTNLENYANILLESFLAPLTDTLLVVRAQGVFLIKILLTPLEALKSEPRGGDIFGKGDLFNSEGTWLPELLCEKSFY